ncbi:hypothetical protein [Aestuariibaculum lutulentum]|uniref:Uncharacterized protein n=1 Tax=Aestuariibaculum lutulentum TaxID=2920935 RepID=A0ABS9RGB4_9FLAO|nr:hypothetical protein [Aestuariibaculum lutulentum]MCH4551984.1 hypothetical protein [Aestuariibaculum lutulentum]
MKTQLHPLVQKTKIELKRLDKIDRLSWKEQEKYNSKFLPITVEPKLRNRALKFMDSLIKKLEVNNHSIKFECNRCHIEMYGQLTEINLRQKYFRKRIKNNSGYSHNSYEKSDKLEFQVGSYARKGWIDRENKNLEDYLFIIYDYLEKDSRRWADLRKRQAIQEAIRTAQAKIDAELSRQKAIEEEKFNQLILDAENHNKANKIRSFLNALVKQKTISNHSNNNDFEKYIEWAFSKADEIDPLNNMDQNFK